MVVNTFCRYTTPYKLHCVFCLGLFPDIHVDITHRLPSYRGNAFNNGEIAFQAYQNAPCQYETLGDVKNVSAHRGMSLFQHLGRSPLLVCLTAILDIRSL